MTESQFYISLWVMLPLLSWLNYIHFGAVFIGKYYMGLLTGIPCFLMLISIVYLLICMSFNI